MLFVIQSALQSAQRYNTVGDWQETNLATLITATTLPTKDHTFLIAVHELVEAYLCKRAGITQEMVDRWDMNYTGDDEPGDHFDCPYHFQHRLAELVERSLAEALGVDWQMYQKEIDRALEGQ